MEGADRILVRLWNEKEYEAEVVGRDPDTDLAVIRIDAKEELPVATLGDSDTLRVGQFAVAMGSPRGFEGSLSFGHISALGREGLGALAAQGLRFQNLIQTDAAINLGNSGGPLVNIAGDVVGINIAIVFGANSIGFAIPVNTAKNIIPQLISEGRVTRGYLGVAIKDANEYADSLSMPDGNGAFVERVQPDTPAERAEIEVYDVIRKVNGEVVEGASDLVRKIAALPPGDNAMLEVWRDEEPMEVEVRLDEWQPDMASAEMPGRSVMGLNVRALNAEIIERMEMEPDTEGVLIVDVEPGSPADDAGLRRGDVILEVARKSVGSPRAFREVIEEEGEPGQKLLIRFMRGPNPPAIVALEVPSE